MFEIHSLLHGTLSLFLECIYSADIIWTEVLYSSPASVLLSLSLACSLLQTHTHTYLQCTPAQSFHILIWAPRPHIQSVPLLPWRPFQPCQHFWDPPGARQFAPSRSFALPIPPRLLLFSFPIRGRRKKKHPPFSRGMTIPSPILSLRFIHPQCLARAISSPPTLTPTLHSLCKCVCIHLLLHQTKRVGGEQRRVHLLLISTAQDELNADSWYFS